MTAGCLTSGTTACLVNLVNDTWPGSKGMGQLSHGLAPVARGVRDLRAPRASRRSKAALNLGNERRHAARHKGMRGSARRCDMLPRDLCATCARPVRYVCVSRTAPREIPVAAREATRVASGVATGEAKSDAISVARRRFAGAATATARPATGRPSGSRPDGHPLPGSPAGTRATARWRGRARAPHRPEPGRAAG